MQWVNAFLHHSFSSEEYFFCPEATGYWEVSRKAFFKNSCRREVSFVGITQVLTLLPAVVMWKYCIVSYQAHEVQAWKLSEDKAAN